MRAIRHHRTWLIAALTLFNVSHAIEQASHMRLPTVPSPATGAGAIEHGSPAKAAMLRMTHKSSQLSPQYQYADSLSAATDGYLDWFLVIYWGALILLVVLTEVIEYTNRAATPESEETGLLKRQSSLNMSSRRSSYSLTDDGEPGKKRTLAQNIFALNLIASTQKTYSDNEKRSQAIDRKGAELSPKLVFSTTLAMGLLQLFTLFLVVYDIDPSASPYTKEPSAPWKKHAHTVNAMKVIMVFFLGLYVFSEAADAFENYVTGIGIKDKNLIAHRFCVLFIPVYHYFITLCVILAGVSVVLSCQSVPDILFSSMAILFITQVDELFWGFFSRTFGIIADWEVLTYESGRDEVQLFKKCIILFPMVWGFGILGRAWYRDQMPAYIVRSGW